MTSTPDQSPAATEVGKVPATDPVEKASAVESEQVPGPDDVAGSPETEDGTDEPQVEDAKDAGEPAGGTPGSAPAGNGPAEPDADQPEARVAATTEPVADEPDEVDAAASSAPEVSSTPAVRSTPDLATDEAETTGEASADAAASADAVDSADAADTSAPETPATEEVAADAPSAMPRRPKRDEAPTEEISIVPPAARPGATDANRTSEAAASPSSASGTSSASSAPASSGRAAVPAMDETFDFKALSFAAIAEAHKRAVGPRTVNDEPEAAEEQEAGDEATAEEARPGAAEASAPTEASEAPAQEEAPAAPPELFVSPATHTPPATAPPSPFPTPAAPQQHQPGAPAQTQPSVPVQPQSPFPASSGGSAHGFPSVHDYAPGASYAGWRPPTPADDAARRRRFALIGGAVAAVIALVVVISVVANMVSRQQWEPIEAMIAEPQDVHPLQLVLGSCVETMPEDGEVSEVLAVPCDASHTAQVVGRTDFADAAIWPGRDAVDKRVALVCGTKQLGPVARTSPVADSVRYVVWGPSEESWDDGDRVGLCLATTAEPITQDLLQ